MIQFKKPKAISLFIMLLLGECLWAKDPNIVLILADDMGYGDLNCYFPENKNKVPTPNLDKLAKEGMRFTDAHSGAAVCSPSRYGILTGRNFSREPFREKISLLKEKCMIEKSQLTLPEFLKNHGYHTGAFGKWHLGQTFFNKQGQADKVNKNTDFSRPTIDGPNDHGFDYFFGMNGTAVGIPICFMENRKTTSIPTVTGKKGRPMTKGFDAAQVMPTLTDKVVEFINDHHTQQPDKPFFLYFPMTAIHTPLVPAPEFIGKTRASIYGDFVHQTDYHIGEVMDALDRNGIRENTILIFTSDNGSHGRPGAKGDKDGPLGGVLTKYGFKYNANWRGNKGDCWEGGHRVPFIVRWPGKIKENSICNNLISTNDIMRTVARLINKEKDLPEHAAEDSYDISPYLLGSTQSRSLRPYAIHLTFYGDAVIRKGDWVAMPYLGSGGLTKPVKIDPKNDTLTGQLYNLKKDPQQKINLWEKHPEQVKGLLNLLSEHSKRSKSFIKQTVPSTK